VDFVFTDIGQAFLDEAERSLKPAAPFLSTARLDIAAPPVPQGFAAGSFDIVIAANVLHATPRLAATLAHARALLRPGGLLAVNEAVAAQDFNTLTFGLTRGWWAFEDAEARLPHAPLLDPPRWRAALAEAGFAGTAVIGEARLQAILLAAADPLARPAPVAAAAPRAAPAPAAGTGGNAIEARLRETVAAALRLAPEEVEPETSFAEYGADSIISVELVRRINDAFGIELKTTALFNYATVRELAAYIRLEHGGDAAPAPEAEAVTGRILDQKERAGRLRGMIRRHLDSKGASPAPPPAPAPATPSPEPAPEPDDLATLLRRLEAGEIRYEDAMTAPLTDG
jgi:acyl carrier protein